MTYEYRTKGTCASKITFSLEDGVIHDVKFTGGCSGNTQGVAALVTGMDAQEAIRRPGGRAEDEGHPLWHETHLLPRPAGEGAGDGAGAVN